MPHIQWQRQGLMAGTIGVMYLLFVFMLYLQAGEDRWTWTIWFAYLLFWGGAAVRQMGGARYVLAEGVLASLTPDTIRRRKLQLVPLATAEVKRIRVGWYVRWQEGRLGRSLTVNPSAEFGAALEAAAAQARAAGGRPTTVQQAGWAVRIEEPAGTGRLERLWLVAALALAALSVWQNQPLIVLPLVGILLWAYLRADGRLLLLGRERLWLLVPGKVSCGIELCQITRLEAVSPDVLLPCTVSGLEPDFRIDAHGGLAARLKRMLAGEPDPQPSPLPAAGSPAAALRCTLCGRSEPGAVAAPDAAPHICRTCADRTRSEAQEGGYGLRGKRPRPM